MPKKSIFYHALIALLLLMVTLGVVAKITGHAVAQPAAVEHTHDQAHVDDQKATYQPPAYLSGAIVQDSKAATVRAKKAHDDTSIFDRIMSILGIFAFIGIAYAMSNNRKKVLWKLVAVGTILQLAFALFILRTSIGKAIFSGLNTAVTALLDFTRAGTDLLFTSFVSGQVESAFVNTAMAILPPIIFFSSLMTVLYHYGVMQAVVRVLAGVMVKLMGTSGSESLSSISNIFVGQTEAPLVVKPYVERMTESELMAVMTGGFATVAGGIMAAYVAMLQTSFPDIAGHLIAASVMSAPASLVIAKIMVPETEVSETMGVAKLSTEKLDANGIDAAARGASDGMRLALNVMAMLLAFVALVAMLNYFVSLPSRVKNAGTVHVANGYLQSLGQDIPEGCDSPYLRSDTIVCTHKALVEVSHLAHAEPAPDLLALSGSQSDDIERIEKLAIFLAQKAPSPLAAEMPIVADCNGGRAGACIALVAKTQSEQWTESIQAIPEKSLWPVLSFEFLLGILFFPIAFLMGIPWHDCWIVGQMLGEKMVLNEFIAYLHLADIVDQLSYRSIVITTYALCGFANFGSIAIQIGGIGGIAPSRRSDLARLGLRAMIAGSIAAFMTATIAGALI